MIDKAAFAAGMGMLAGNFGREIDAPISRGYYAILSPALTTDQFNATIVRAMQSETFWPPAARLLELAGAEPDVADEAFNAVRATLRAHGGPQYLPAALWQSFPAETRRAVTAVGGLWRVNGADGETEHRLRKRFRDAFHAPVPKEIPPPHPDRRIERLVAETSAALTSPVEDVQSLFPHCRRCGKEITDGTEVPALGVLNRVAHRECETRHTRESAA